MTGSREAGFRDHRYGERQVWSGRPNGSLVNEVSSLDPGRALDVVLRARRVSTS